MGCGNCPISGLQNNQSETSGCFGCNKLSSYDWMNDLPEGYSKSKLVEVKFKNTRKEYYLNDADILLKRGDLVTVSAHKGHDTGVVTLTGRMAELSMTKRNYRVKNMGRVYRKASRNDIDQFESAKQKEQPTMIRARKIVNELQLDMKISEVEFQADGGKAVFYYIVEGRVDFRELIKVYAKTFGCRIEMKQIGARQEAAMVGGIGSCGKELCCSSWRTNLSSVSANASKIQDLPHNLQKLTGQCGKLKCCLMYELDAYIEAQRDFPDQLLEIDTEKGVITPVKRDLLKKIIWYSLKNEPVGKIYGLPLREVKESIMHNKKGIQISWPPLSEDEGLISEGNDQFISFQNDLNLFKFKKPKSKSAMKKKNSHR